MVKDHSAVVLLVIAVAIVAAYLTPNKKLDNPLFFLAIVSLFVYGFGCMGRLAGTRIGSPGLVAFFGGK